MKRIVFILAPLIILFLALRPFSDHSISGKIVDDSNIPLQGVKVSVKGTTNFTTTSKDGKFSLKVADKNATLVLELIGYSTTEIAMQGKSSINIMYSKDQAVAIESKKQKSVTEREKETIVEQREMVNQEYLPAPTGNNAQDARMYNSIKTSGVPMYGPDYITEDYNREGYDHINENKFLKATDNPLSTFSIDVDAASYSNIRRFINQGQLPPEGAVRIEEMVNYFHYNYPQPIGEHPFSINTEMTSAPWNKDHKLVLIGLQGKKIEATNLPASNLVFLIDVSGSMSDANKLPLVKTSLKLLVDQLREKDKLSIVVYAGAAGLVLPATSGDDKMKIKTAIDNLEAGGSTAGGEGIELAYKTANANFIKGANNRVILCTDGDFNIGESSDDAMERLIEKERQTGVFLTVLGYGMGNYQDAKMQKLADKGNGNHAYIDDMSEAKKVLVNEFGGTLFTIAKDVKLQVEFNPKQVQAYRLIGYENRMLNKEDFNDDKKDAGELGSGHTVTALYEIIPVGVATELVGNVDPLKYQSDSNPFTYEKGLDDLLTVKFRYKAPEGSTSKLLESVMKTNTAAVASENLRFAGAVAEFGMLLRNSTLKGKSSYDDVLRVARAAKGEDEEGYRAEFIKLVENARLLTSSASR